MAWPATRSRSARGAGLLDQDALAAGMRGHRPRRRRPRDRRADSRRGKEVRKWSPLRAITANARGAESGSISAISAMTWRCRRAGTSVRIALPNGSPSNGRWISSSRDKYERTRHGANRALTAQTSDWGHAHPRPSRTACRAPSQQSLARHQRAAGSVQTAPNQAPTRSTRPSLCGPIPRSAHRRISPAQPDPMLQLRLEHAEQRVCDLTRPRLVVVETGRLIASSRLRARPHLVPKRDSAGRRVAHRSSLRRTCSPARRSAPAPDGIRTAQAVPSC